MFGAAPCSRTSFAMAASSPHAHRTRSPSPAARCALRGPPPSPPVEGGPAPADRAAPEDGRGARDVGCPSSAEYWHMGDMTTRFLSATPAKRGSPRTDACVHLAPDPAGRERRRAGPLGDAHVRRPMTGGRPRPGRAGKRLPRPTCAASARARATGVPRRERDAAVIAAASVPGLGAVAASTPWLRPPSPSWPSPPDPRCGARASALLLTRLLAEAPFDAIVLSVRSPRIPRCGSTSATASRRSGRSSIASAASPRHAPDATGLIEAPRRRPSHARLGGHRTRAGPARDAPLLPRRWRASRRDARSRCRLADALRWGRAIRRAGGTRRSSDPSLRSAPRTPGATT